MMYCASRRFIYTVRQGWFDWQFRYSRYNSDVYNLEKSRAGSERPLSEPLKNSDQ